MVDTLLLWLAFGCWAASLTLAVLILRARRRRAQEAQEAVLAAEQAAFLARIETWMRTR